MRQGGKEERDSGRMRERERERRWEGETEGISREEHTSAERLYVLCSPAVDACVCLLTEVLFCLHHAKGNRHLTKPRLCAVQKRETGEGVRKCEEKPFGAPLQICEDAMPRVHAITDAAYL